MSDVEASVLAATVVIVWALHRIESILERIEKALKPK
jgi:hypothetical protein